MKLLYIADGRSPTAIHWISYFIQAGHQVHLATTFPCQPIVGLVTQVSIPVAMSGSYSAPGEPGGGRVKLLRRLVPVAMRTRLRQLTAPATFKGAASELTDVIEQVQPDLIHAMRIPYEGMVAAIALSQNTDGKSRAPLLVSVWGNDFTLHARSTRAMEQCTRLVLQGCDALHTDCLRDLKLAREYGFAATKPSIVLPGGGGVQLDIFHPSVDIPEQNVTYPTAEKSWLRIINPRGYRAYVRNDTFFKAIPHVLKQYPEVHFICPGMADASEAQNWIKRLQLGTHVDLLPAQSRPAMAELFRQSQISLSITTHDGTPNSLLEAMACGCFPIAGDLESLREWITDGENGSLVDPKNPGALARAIIEAISHPEMRMQAREKNLQLVREQAEHGMVMQLAEQFYGEVIRYSGNK